MASASRRLTVAWHAGLDLVLAAGFLALLAFVLPMVLEAARSIFGALGWGDFAWRPMLEAARDEPLGAGIMVTGMLATTLLPTALHFFIASMALLIPNFDLSRPSRSRLRGWMDLKKPHYFITIGVVGWLAGGALMSWLVLVLIGTTTYALVSAFGPDAGEILLWIAEQGAAIGGHPGGAPNI